MLPHLKDGAIGKFASFGMNPVRELDDVCGAHGVAIYHKSLLYLVSKALEKPRNAQETEVPLVGMAHFAETEVDGTSFVDAVRGIDGSLVWSPNATPAQSRSDAAAHGAFDDDIATMTSVLLRILGRTASSPATSSSRTWRRRPPVRSSSRSRRRWRTSHPRSCSPRSAARGPPRPAGRSSRPRR